MTETQHDPLAVLQVATEHDISEEQASTAMTWAGHMLIHAWREYARFWGQSLEDSAAMERWGALISTEERRSVLEDAIEAVKGADQVLDTIYREQDAHLLHRRRALRTNRPRVRIR
ncbi:hypothetical protein OG453_07030 [Streptomyces sp. NBC_01381]|uniref:hypothetical protein n=1 Tax=Streptomyces sp. NBC_01381 TaxID=2903845 RepID=UPI00225BE9FF|nr:hypothetical protein [Streptomyces sp. NBC_01381]MCX4666421.1 hypothetical protein [Streptomyces sp. NBC_01381]